MLKRTIIIVYLTLTVFSLLLQPAAGGIHLSKSIGDFKIKSHGFITETGYYHIYGEIENIGNTNYTNVTLKYTFYDSKGQPIYSINQTISHRILLAGRISPFACQLLNASIAKKVKSYKIEIADYDMVEEPPPCELEIVNYRRQNNTIIGVVQNHGALEAKFVIVYVIFYYQNKSVMVLGDPWVTPNIGPSTSMPFEIKFPELNASSINIENVKYYSLTAESINYLSKNEVRHQLFSEQTQNDNEQEQAPWWNDPIIMTFIIVVVFSALVLIVVYLVAKFGRWRKKRYLRRVKRRYYKTKT